MNLSRQELNQYDSMLGKLEGEAFDYVSSRVGSYIEQFPGATVEEIREFAIECATYAVSAFGDAAATAAADLYDAMAAASGMRLKPALIDTSDPARFIDSGVRYQVGKLLGGDVQEFVRQCAMVARDQVARRANETMRVNARRDNLRYARVPTGGETCTFCAMLASRGFAYTSAKSAGEGHKFHRNCRCKVVPEFGETSVEGYDPGEWRDTWKKFREIDQMRGQDGAPMSDFDKNALKTAYLSGGIDYEKALEGMEGHSIPESKLTRYSLDPERQPDKARAFREALGYTKEDAAEVAAKVYEHMADHEPEKHGEGKYGTSYTTVMTMTGKNGKSAKVLAGWIRDADLGDGKLRLTTIHVDK